MNNQGNSGALRHYQVNGLIERESTFLMQSTSKNKEDFFGGFLAEFRKLMLNIEERSVKLAVQQKFYIFGA